MRIDAPSGACRLGLATKVVVPMIGVAMLFGTLGAQAGATAATRSGVTSSPHKSANVCVTVGMTYPIAYKIFGAGTMISYYTGFGAYNFCAIRPFKNPGGFVEVVLNPKSEFTSLLHHYSYQGGSIVPTAGISGAKWREVGKLVASIVFIGGKYAIAFAADEAAPPYPTNAQYIALAKAIRAHLG